MHITTAVIFLFLIIFCIGAAVGGLIERALKNRSNPPPALPSHQIKIHLPGRMTWKY